MGSFPVAASNIIILINDAVPAYVEITKQLADKLKENNDVRIFKSDEQRKPNTQANLTITLGYNATKTVINSGRNGALLAVLRSKRDYFQLLSGIANSSVQFSVLLTDQPLIRQLQLAKKLMPHLQQVGILYSSIADISEFQPPQTTAEVGVKLQKVDDSGTVFRLGQELLYKVDALIASSDNHIYNKHNLHGILLSAYRNRVPVIGYSRQMVAAGALLTAYTPVDLLVPQLINMIKFNLKATGRNQANYHYPKQFRVAVNQDIARALGIVISSQNELETLTYNSVNEIK